MKYKIIALDIDGTLTNSCKEITPATRNSLIDFQRRGGKVVLASGRPTMGIVPYAEALKLSKFGGYILSYNGGCIVDCSSGNTLFQDKLPLEVVPEICSAIRNKPVGINTYEDDKIIAGNQVNSYTELECRINGMKLKYVEDFVSYVNFDITKCLIQGDPEEIVKLEKELSERYKGRLGIFRSEAFFLEIVPDGIDKAKSIGRLLGILGLTHEECAACGDGFNDISMIEYAGLGVAMANAKQPVKDAADYITLSNDQDGIAHLLKRLEHDPAGKCFAGIRSA